MEYVIDGARIGSLEEFLREFSRVVIPCYSPPLSSSLDAFNDILRGGFGTPEEGFTLRWVNSAASRANLGYAETARVLERRIETCHPENVDRVRKELALARSGQGPTVFDWLVEIIRVHGPGGSEAEDNVRLILE